MQLELDRELAIERALSAARANDVIVIAGKATNAGRSWPASNANTRITTASRAWSAARAQCRSSQRVEPLSGSASSRSKRRFVSQSKSWSDVYG